MNKTLRLLCLSTLVSLGGFAGVQPLAVTIMERQGLGPAKIGLLSALIFGGVLLLAPFQPALAVRFGAMRTYQAGKLLAVAGFCRLCLVADRGAGPRRFCCLGWVGRSRGR